MDVIHFLWPPQLPSALPDFPSHTQMAPFMSPLATNLQGGMRGEIIQEKVI